MRFIPHTVHESSRGLVPSEEALYTSLQRFDCVEHSCIDANHDGVTCNVQFHIYMTNYRPPEAYACIFDLTYLTFLCCTGDLKYLIHVLHHYC